MAQGSKTGLIILIVFCVIFAATTAILFVLHTQEHQMRVEAENKLMVLENRKAQLERQLDKVEKEKSAIELELSKAESKISMISEKLELEKKYRQQTEDKLSMKEEELNSLRSELERFKTQVSQLQKRYNELSQKNEQLSNKLQQLRLAKKVLESKMGVSGAISEEDEGVSLGTVVVKPTKPQEERGTRALQGRILVVNKEFNFVMVDLGKINGIQPGAIFGIYHAGELIAKAKVEKVYDDMCSAVILDEGKKAEVEEDDKVEVL